MKDQEDLFGTDPHKLSKRIDPETSHEAGHLVDSAYREKVVFDTVSRFPHHTGMICQEIATVLGKHMHDTSPRISGLLEKGLLYRQGDKRLGDKSNRYQLIVRVNRRKESVQVEFERRQLELDDITDDEAEALAEDADRDMLGDDFLLLQDHDIGNK